MLRGLNSYLAAYVKGEKCVVWNPDTGVGMVGNILLFKKACDIASTVKSNQDALTFFDSLYKHETEIIEQFPVWYDQLNKASSSSEETRLSIKCLRLTLVTKCNLRCSYCYQEEIEWSEYRQKSMMDFETAREAIDYYFKSVVIYTKKAEIVFYGGEPILNWEVLRRSTEYIRDKCNSSQTPLKISILTNGTLLKPHIIDFLTENHVRVSVSIDGVGDVHDKSRPTRAGGGSFQKIHNALLDFKRRNYQAVSLACTLNSNNWQDVCQLVDYAADMGIKHLSLNDDYIAPHSTMNDVPEELIIDKVVEFIHYAWQKGIEPHGFYIDRLRSFVKGLGTSKKTPKFELHSGRCGGCGFEMNVHPNGEIKPCPGIQKPLGHIKDLDSVKRSSILKVMSQRNVTTLLECGACPIRGICVGGCAANVEQFKNGNYYAKPSNCSLYYRSFEKFLESIL